MNGNLIDTNIIIGLLNGDSEIFDYLSKLETIAISSISIGELVYGAEKSIRRDENIQNILEFSSYYLQFEVTKSVALVYGRIKAQLQKDGKMIPENDIWISAIAIENDLTVITKDKHFSNIKDLRLITL